MKPRRYSVFGKNIEIILNETYKVLVAAIDSYFNLYKSLSDKDSIDIRIVIGNKDFPQDIQSKNPSTHMEITDGFISVYPKIKVAIEVKKVVQVHLSLDKPGNFLIAYLKKLHNIQYHSIYERVPQILFESVLVPLVYFDDQKFLIHSSAFKSETGKTILIGGTGGVGKTSLEMELCLNRGYSFISDDISVVNKEGDIFPNLAFPKIYGYNLVNNSKLKRKMFSGTGLADKLAWKFKYFFFGAKGVRRVISPLKAYGKYELNKNALTDYYILTKGNVNEITISDIDAKTAAKLSNDVMKTEYSQFNNHIHWHEFNRLSLNKKPIITLDLVLQNWEKMANDVFTTIPCKLVTIPLKIEHKELLNKLSNLIDS